MIVLIDMIQFQWSIQYLGTPLSSNSEAIWIFAQQPQQTATVASWQPFPSIPNFSLVFCRRMKMGKHGTRHRREMLSQQLSPSQESEISNLSAVCSIWQRPHQYPQQPV